VTDAGAAGRARILARIEAALQGRARVPHPGEAPGVITGDVRLASQGPEPAEHKDGRGVDVDEDRRPPGGLARAALLEVFTESLRAGGGEVAVAHDVDEAAAWLREFTRSFSSAAVSPWVPPPLRPALPELEPARAELGVSVAVAGAAATGSLLLSSEEGRAHQLLPPVHLVWVEGRSLHVELRDALEDARGRGALPAALAIHSGPSKSADIGRIVVTGVHGPGRLIAVVTDFPLGVP
jgi:L-lactate dehydrogenase complex protein LldG